MTAPPKIRESEVSEGHPTLFHYTTESGLYGILDSQQLWATHFSYMNDSEELRAARRVLHSAMYESLRERIKPFVKKRQIEVGSFEEACLQQSDKLVEAYYRTTAEVVSPFICSFCSHEADKEAKVDGLANGAAMALEVALRSNSKPLVSKS